MALGLLVAHPAQATDYYIAPNGSSGGTGSINSPWDITSGLQKTAVVKPGDTIWLRGGTYGSGGSLVYNISVKGSGPSAPVTIRQYRGERATVNGALRVNGSYTRLWGFEVTNKSTKRAVSNIDTERPRGILIGTSTYGVKIINMIVHDVGRAGIAGGANNFEIYGSLMWGNGIYDSSVDQRGDAMYLNLWKRVPDANAVNYVRDNIGFRNFYAGMKVYTEWSDSYIDGYDIEGNISFDNGARVSGVHEHGNFIVNSSVVGKPIKRLKFINNFTYRTPSSTNPYNAEFGCVQNSGIQCEDAVIRDNYFVSGSTAVGAFKVQNWKNLQVSGNTSVGNGSGSVTQWIRQFTPNSVQWDNNKYYRGNSAPFKFINSSTHSYSFASWRSATSVDAAGSYSASRPTGVKAVVRKNIYEPGERANIVVYNWDLKSSVSVNLADAGLAEGTAFEIMDAQNYYGAPIAKGVYYDASPNVTLPMNLTTVSQLVGTVTHLTNTHTAPEFGAFILRKTAGGTSEPSVPDSTPPTTSITSPTNGATVSGTVTVTATASDNQGVTRLEYFADGSSTPFATRTSAGSMTWNTSGVSSGTHTLQTKAYDAAGNVGVSAPISVTVSGTSTGTSPTTKTFTLTPVADTYVRNGSYANTSYGTRSSALYARNTTESSNDRDIYLRFNLSSVNSVNSAKFRIYAQTGATATITTAAYAVASTSWSESGTTWNNRPGRGSRLGSVTVSGTAYRWYEIDLTNYLKTQKAAGMSLVSIAVDQPSSASTYTKFYSRESSTNKPQLVIQGS
ncbi:MAG TPA: DNRLRE domain-containing protein [Clostridia bacterium]|nr:DNRLRE domain-containing protein [Clostridia bacterium]